MTMVTASRASRAEQRAAGRQATIERMRVAWIVALVPLALCGQSWDFSRGMEDGWVEGGRKGVGGGRAAAREGGPGRGGKAGSVATVWWKRPHPGDFQFQAAARKQGGGIRFSVDGKPLLKAVEPKPLGGGLIGLRTFHTYLWWGPEA